MIDPSNVETTTSMPVVRDGQVAYRAPKPMRVNDLQRVTVRVAGANVPPGFTSALPGAGSVTTAPARVGDRLRASLTGPDFEISLVGDTPERRLTEGRYAEWSWNVRPKRSGKLVLDFSLYVVVSGDDVPVYEKSYDHSVEVEVNFMHSLGKWVKDYGALTGLSIPVLATAGWTFYSWLRKRKEKEKATPRTTDTQDDQCKTTATQDDQ